MSAKTRATAVMIIVRIVMNPLFRSVQGDGLGVDVLVYLDGPVREVVASC